MKNMITIDVTSGAGVGKSCVSQLIKEALASYGITATIHGMEDERPGVMEASFEERVKSVAKKGTIVRINTKQLARRYSTEYTPCNEIAFGETHECNLKEKISP